MIAIVDYGAGNTRSVMFALLRLGVKARLTADPRELREAEGMILPGVGAFGRAMEQLKDGKLDIELVDLALAGKPLLGICLGHQLLFSESLEHGRHKGLGLIRGSVRRFGGGVKVPHMGWNRVRYVKQSVLFKDIGNKSFFYFAHSFCTCPEDDSFTLAYTDHGMDFVSSVGDGNIFGVQFHPEKSGETGKAMLMNFCHLCRRGRH